MDNKEMYNTFEWRLMRLLVLERDENKCVKCGGNSCLQAHHTVYSEGLFPWEYQINNLVTLCKSCHERFHDNTPSCKMFSRKVGKCSMVNKIVKVLKKDFNLEHVIDKKLFERKRSTLFAKQVLGIEARRVMVEKYTPNGLSKLTDKEYDALLEETIKSL